MSNTHQGRPRRGMTLIELLVVIAIMIIVFAALVPQIRPAIEDLKLREGSRQVNAYIASAQAVAAQNKRPAGVRLQPVNGSGVLEVVSLETPPPYAGDTLDARCNVQGANGGSASATLSSASLITSLGIGPGDTIRLNYRGPYFLITSVSGGNITFSYSSLSPPPTPSQLPYQIYRKPSRSSVGTLQLPRGTCVDLSYSGEGTTGQFGANDVIDIMFTPDGRPFYYRNLAPVVPQASVYFLIGRVENLGQPAQISDLSNRWVSVRALSGQCITFENQPGGNVASGRTLASSGQGTGGQ